MKKILSNIQHQRHAQYRSRKERKARYRFLKWSIKRNISNNKKSQRPNRKSRLAYREFTPGHGYATVKAPMMFSFIRSPLYICRFVNKLKQHYDNKQKVYIDLSGSTIIDYSAIVVLLSIMVRFKAAGILFNGNFPKNQNSDSILRRSGFFEALDISYDDTDQYTISPESADGIHTHSNKRVDPVLANRLIRSASELFNDTPRNHPGVYRTLIELMQNTHNHADSDLEAVKHWWVSVNLDHNNKVASFSFVDYGVGIFESLKAKKPKSKFHDWMIKLSNRHEWKDNADLLSLILNGELHQTVTGKPFRGKGLPGIKATHMRNQLSNLYIISNNVCADVGRENFTLLDAPFSGTFVHWEVSEDND